MSGNASGDHILNVGPIGAGGKSNGRSKSGRKSRRLDAKLAGKTDMGRDELFRQQLRAVPKGMRLRGIESTDRKGSK